MGKKLQGAKLRAKKRAAAAVAEIQEQQAEQAVVNSNIGSTTSTTSNGDDLFVVDTTGEAFVPHHKRPPNKKKKQQISEKDQQQMEALLQKHGVEKVKKMAQEGKKAILARPRARGVTQKTKTNYDLWGNDDGDDTNNNNKKEKKSASQMVALSSLTKKEEATAAASRVKSGIGSTLAGVAPPHCVTKAAKLSASSNSNSSKKPSPVVVVVAVDVAKPGQSYHPDKVQHQKLLQKSAAVEVARNQALEQSKAPISQGMSAETRALLLGDSDSNEEKDSSDDDEQATASMAMTAVAAGNDMIPKRRRDANKLTRAQRNKQKRARARNAEEASRKRTKTLLKQVGEIPVYKKELAQKEQQQQARAKQQQQQAAATPEVLGRDVEFKVAAANPLHAPTVPVALSSEIKSATTTYGLRTLKPKGSLATDRALSLADRTKQQLVVVRSSAAGTKRSKRKKKCKSIKGAHNRDAYGTNFEILG